MDNKNTSDIDLLKYLTGKKFNELTDQEKEFVLKHVTEKEFTILQETSAHISQIGDLERLSTSPNEQVKVHLLKQFRQKNKKKIAFTSVIETIINYRIPVYQPALVFLLIISLYLLFDKQDHLNNHTYLSMDTNALKNSPKTNSYMASKEIYNDSLLPENIDTEVIPQPEKIYSKKKAQAKETTYVKPTSDPGVFNIKKAQVTGTTLRDDTLLSVFFISIQ
jgi:hypothetical protein